MDMHPRHSRRAALALAGVTCFAVAATASQFLRVDLDWIDVPLSFYLLGPGGWVLSAAYIVMGAALALLGIEGRAALAPAHRSAAPTLLFVMAGAALCVVAVADTNTWSRPNTLHGLVHGIAAQTTFLCATVAMLLQSWRMRRDPAWRGRMRGALPWSTACFVGLWIQAMDRDLPRGLGQKLLIAMMVLWLLVFAWRLWQRRASPASQAAVAISVR